MKTRITPPCTVCGKVTRFGNTNGMPNMVGFIMDDGRTINMCQDCVMKLGAMSDSEKAEFFKNLGIEKSGG